LQTRRVDRFEQHGAIVAVRVFWGLYQIKRLLGEGGSKVDYLARDTRLEREVAFALIKTVVS